MPFGNSTSIERNLSLLCDADSVADLSAAFDETKLLLKNIRKQLETEAISHSDY